MAILTREQLMEKIKACIGDNTDDDSLGLIEDVSDTITDLSDKANDTTDWKSKYVENDRAWRDKYKARFFEPVGATNGASNPEPEPDADNRPTTYDDLFTEGGNNNG